MDALSALNTAVAHSGLTRSKVSVQAGRSRQFIATIMGQGHTPSSDTLADFADICGYDLALIKRDGSETIIIDPPKRKK